MAGISEATETPGVFTAYVVRHTTGETLGTQQFTNIFEAVRTLNDIPRTWTFESTSKCGGDCSKGSCGKSGGGCGKKKTTDTDSSANAESTEASSCSTGQC